MLISIILPTKNNIRTIKKCLDSIKKQTYQNIELICIDNYSNDGTFEILQNFKTNFTIKVYQHGPERNTQRPYGFEKSNGDIVYFLDSDMYLTPKVVENIIESFKKEKDLGGVIIPEKNIIGKTFTSKVKAFERELYNHDNKIEAARAFKRSIYEEVGGYNNRLISGEDWDLCEKVKRKYQISRIRGYTNHDEGDIKLYSILKKKFYYGQKFIDYHKENGFSKTVTKIYFFRKSFYINSIEYIKHPLLFLGFLVLINSSLIAGGTGFLVGKIHYYFKRNEKKPKHNNKK